MQRTARPLVGYLAAAMLVLQSETTLAEVPSNSGGPLVVDVVALKKGGSLRGAILQREPNGSLIMAVSHDWLRKANPSLFDKELQRDRQSQRAAWMQVIERIDKLLNKPPEATRLV